MNQEKEHYLRVFALNWLQYCKSNDINIAQLFRRLNNEAHTSITYPIVFQWSQGKVRYVSFYTLCELAKAIDVPLTELLTDKGLVYTRVRFPKKNSL